MTKPQKAWSAEIGLLRYPECQLSAVYGLSDLFRIAGEWAEDGTRRVRVTHWSANEDGALACVWDSDPGTPHQLDYIIAPPSIVMPSKMQQMPNEADWLRANHAQGTRICSVCAGAFVLAESGVLDGRRVTTHWAFADTLSKRHSDVEVLARNLIVDDGDVISAGGILAWTDLGLMIVERLFGRSRMLETARFLVTEPPRSSQLPYIEFVPTLDHGDDAVRLTQHHIHADISAAMTLDQLADLAGLGRRTFIRRFAKATSLNPTEYIQHTRIAKARSLLEMTNRPLEQIAWDIGYSDPSAFRKVFQRICGVSASKYRRQFGTPNW